MPAAASSRCNRRGPLAPLAASVRHELAAIRIHAPGCRLRIPRPPGAAARWLHARDVNRQQPHHRIRSGHRRPLDRFAHSTFKIRQKELKSPVSCESKRRRPVTTQVPLPVKSTPRCPGRPPALTRAPSAACRARISGIISDDWRRDPSGM
ncbi:hypothetical protein BS78_K154500 [Paspalum vaginatum]|uniref:Uncharacterized protein n=1 Tax=Paspalum vaginatum TaxID=158149 RepID=A0A9W8CF37_9POAL|nr:hypothetical protein BS78_K154500 [Paspalum vaginatum]